MGLKDFFSRSAQTREELTSERLSAKFGDLHLVSLSDMPMRERVAVCGEIRRMSIKPRAGIPAVEVEISDGTADLTVIFSGRERIPGIGHNRGLIVTGVAHIEGTRKVMLNPAYQLLPKTGQ
jgi:hypothetical protein